MTSSSRTYVLIVDDDLDLREMLVHLLALIDVDAGTARNGLEALRSCERRLPDVILLDMKMPIMDGWTFCRELHSRYARRPPVIVISAAPDPAERAAEVNAEAWLGKPFDAGDLLGLVRQLAPPRS
jgi:CheY-like chemotaxis protein